MTKTILVARAQWLPTIHGIFPSTCHFQATGKFCSIGPKELKRPWVQILWTILESICILLPTQTTQLEAAWQPMTQLEVTDRDVGWGFQEIFEGVTPATPTVIETRNEQGGISYLKRITTKRLGKTRSWIFFFSIAFSHDSVLPLPWISISRLPSPKMYYYQK